MYLNTSPDLADQEYRSSIIIYLIKGTFHKMFNRLRFLFCKLGDLKVVWAQEIVLLITQVMQLLQCFGIKKKKKTPMVL